MVSDIKVYNKCLQARKNYNQEGRGPAFFENEGELRPLAWANQGRTKSEDNKEGYSAQQSRYLSNEDALKRIRRKKRARN